MTSLLPDPSCHGNNSYHCCWIDGKVCPYLEENTVEGRRWACGLLRRLGTWEKVYADPRYQATDAAQSLAPFGCGDWPQNLPDVMANGHGLCCFQGAN